MRSGRSFSFLVASKFGNPTKLDHGAIKVPVRLRQLATAFALVLSGGIADSVPTLGAMAVAYMATSDHTAHAAANALCSGSPSAECADVTADGVHYTSGVSTVNVRDDVTGTTVVTPGTIGIELSRTGVSGAAAPDVEFMTVLWDTDNDPATEPVDVVTRDGSTPQLINGNYILVTEYDTNNDPKTFEIGTDTYTGLELVQYLAANSSDAGAAITGSLTVNNNAGPLSQGAPLSTTDAKGIVVSSTGGNGGSGGCSTILFWSWCDDGYRGGDAGSVAVNSNSTITLYGGGEGNHGVTAISQGGNGGNGAGWFGLFGSTPGGGGDGGNGALVSVMLGEDSNITTYGNKSYGVFAQSRGGNGGSGGDVSAAIVLGSDGGNGGDAGPVLVDNAGTILTKGWNSHGIYARSVGAGAGSGSDASGIYAEGGNGGGESSGGAVTVNNSGSITTEQSDAFGILAQSIGGGGGDGGGAGGWFTVGGLGGSGGGSGVVSVFDSGKVQTGTIVTNEDGTVETSGDRSTAIFAQSIGGGGGNGGDAVSVSSVVSVAVGGAGGLGGDGNDVYVTTQGSDIDTAGNHANGIQAQSIGGGGGNGGLAVSGTLPGGAPFNVSVALGGNGGGGGDAGELVSVQTSSETTIDTIGAGSHGIMAQSVGGGGGNGGTSFAGSGGPGLSVAVSLGGKGGVAGAGKKVDVDNAGTITTHGDLSAGIFTQSIGGGGGNGGYSGSLAIGGSSASVAIGGAGASGGAAGEIDIVNSGTIKTGGQGAAGVFAQSVGGGGGNGGSALAGSIGLASVSTTVGGVGGAGNYGGLVDILNTGLIMTQGNNSAGVFAQSVGGGGGSGGDATSLALAGPVAMAVAVGGSGGTGGNGGEVLVANDGRIVAEGPNSDGVFAQSIGGSGGSGGSATTGTLVFPIEIEGVEIPAISANVAVGGRGAGGGLAGTVSVTNTGEIETTDFMSNGVFAQSVGGSGGKGGNATNISIAYDATFTGSVAVGGSGGKGGTGNTVTVGNTGLIRTQGDFSNGVFAQSVGGGGGAGGNATNVSLSISPPPTAPEDFIPTPSASFSIAVGGDGGDAATGGEVTVTNEGTIQTEGHFAVGVMAQSVGGSGGVGGDARTIQVELTADPLDFLPLTSLTSLDMTMVFGGAGGTGSNGGNVTVTNGSTLAAANVVTTGAFAHGIVAQSVGGGGGSGGSAMTFEFSNADIVPDIPVLDDISGLTTLEMTLQGSGGGGGDGGGVTLNSAGDVLTSGDFAMGVVAQSVAGGGGLAGFYNPQGITNNEIVNSIFNTFVDTEAGLSFAGSVGGAGSAGHVIVNHTGNIETLGDGAHGLFAQSVAGLGSAGDVDVTFSGAISASGKDADGIYAQSGGGSGAAEGNGNAKIEIAGGTVQGGSGSGAGVQFADGATNTLTNAGVLWALSGLAVAGTGGDETVFNDGRVIGNVSLGTGSNGFDNRLGSQFFAGTNVDLGGGLLSNTGEFFLGTGGAYQDTSLVGSFAQSAPGSFTARIDVNGGERDRLVISGNAALGGELVVQRNGGYVRDDSSWEVLRAAGATGTFATETLPAPAPLLFFDVEYDVAPTLPSSVSIRAQALPFDTYATTRVGRNTARYLESIAPVTTGGLNLAMGELQLLPLGEHDPAYIALSSETHDSYTTAALDTTKRYGENVREQMRQGRALQRDRYADYLISSGGGAEALPPVGALREFHGLQMWVAPLYANSNVDEEGGFTGYEADVWGTSAGVQVRLDRRSFVGFSGGYAKTRLDLDQNEGLGQVKNGYATLFGSVWGNRWYGQALLSYGHHRFEDERLTQFGSISDVAKSEHDGQSVSIALDFGLDARTIRAWNAAPYVSIEYAYLSEDAYTEHGTGSLLLTIEERDTNSVVSELGLRLSGVRLYGLVTPDLTVGWRHDYDVDERTLGGRFVTGPVTPFSLPGRYIQQDAARLGFSLRVDREDFPVHAALQTEGILGGGAQDYLASIRLGYLF